MNMPLPSEQISGRAAQGSAAPEKKNAPIHISSQGEQRSHAVAQQPSALPADPGVEKKVGDSELSRLAPVFGGESVAAKPPASSFASGPQPGPPSRSTDGPVYPEGRPKEELAPAKKETYSGPMRGEVIWSGRIEKGQEVRIEGSRPTHGTLHGALPGVPVMIEVNSPDIGITDPPGPDNGWKTVSFRSKKGIHLAVVIRWTVNN
jgi:hypothetical protein